MSEFKNVGLITHSLKIPNQTYEHLITFFNIHGDPNKINEVFFDSRFDLLGFVPEGFLFKSEEAVERIVNAFNSGSQKIAFLLCPPMFHGKCPYFINKKLLKVEQPVKDLSDMLFLIKESGLEAMKATEELFIYEH